MKIHVNVLSHVIHPNILGFCILPSLHPLKLYHVSAIACTHTHVHRYVINCVVVPLITHPVLVLNWSVYVLIVKYAVIVLFPVTKSCLVIPVVPSDHHENVYPVFATAATNVPVLL